MKKIIEDFMNSFDDDFAERHSQESHQKHPFLQTTGGVLDEELDRSILHSRRANSYNTIAWALSKQK